MLAQPQYYSGLCSQVIDGDTIRVRHWNGTVTLRLARVYAPEIGQHGAFAAWWQLLALVGNRYVTYQVVARDVYSRLVAEVWVGPTHVNELLRASGYR